MRDEIYDKVLKSATERRTTFKTTGKPQKINLVDTQDNTRYFFTIGQAETSRKYEFMVVSKRKPDFINALLDAVDERLRLEKSEQLHWGRLNHVNSHEIVFPVIKEIDKRLHGARVTIVPASYNDINHEVKGLLHAIYGRETAIARIKIHEVPNEAV